VNIIFNVVQDPIKRIPVLKFYNNIEIIEWLYCVWLIKGCYEEMKRNWN